MSPDPKESEIKVILTDEDVALMRARLGDPGRTLRQKAPTRRPSA